MRRARLLVSLASRHTLAGGLAFCVAAQGHAAWRRLGERYKQRDQDLTASVCGSCASREFPEGCDAGVSGHVERRGFDHAVELETEDVIVGEVRARAKRAVRAGLWVPEDEAGVRPSE